MVLVWTLVALMLLVPAASAAEPWLRTGFDPGRTGAIPFEGPQTNDTAFVVELPGVPVANTVLVDHIAYLATRDAADFGFDGDTDGLDTAALWRIDISNGDVQKVLDFPDRTGPEMITPELVFYEDGDDLVALEVSSGEARWVAQVAQDDPLVTDRDYVGTPLLVDDTLYAGFTTGRGASVSTLGGGSIGQQDPPTLGVMALDVATGEVLWEQNRADEPQRLDGDPRDLYGESMALAADEQRIYAYFKVGLEDGSPINLERLQYEIWGLDAGDGDVLWNRSDTAHREVGVHTPLGPGTLLNDAGDTCCTWPVVTQTAVHIRLDAFSALNKADGTDVWTSPAGRTDQIRMQGSTAMGARDDVFIGTSPQTVYRLDAVDGELDWLKNAASPSQVRVYGMDPVALDGTTAYLPVLEDTCGLGGVGFEARDVETGELTWAWRYLPDVGRDGCSITTPSRAAFGQGMALIGTNDGSIHVLGRTDASLGIPSFEIEMYPPEGEPVTLEVPEPEPGAFGPATRYMMDWGDGTVTGWQEDPVFTHTYNETGDVTARVIAGNDANQTSSSFVTVHVGQEAPTEPNWISERFEPDNQDMTFGILGLLVAATGGAIGVTQRYRKRSRLQDELDALERGFEETRDRPGTCEALLETRQARARSLVLDGVLDEQQAALVDARAEELKRQLRTRSLQQEFGFLPYALVQKAQEMLEDGRVTALEREAFLRAVEEDTLLTSDQKATVRERIEAWHARDRQGGGGGAGP